MGKGSKPRDPHRRTVTDEEFGDNWDATFKNKKQVENCLEEDRMCTMDNPCKEHERQLLWN